MKGIFVLWLALFTCSSLWAQRQTTLIILRHAEKVSDGTKDPGLTEEGLARANRLATMLESQTVTAIYSTPYQRTRLTVAPLAAKKNLTITEYDAGSKSSISEIVQKNAGGTVVIVGHSNTVPAMLNQLIGKEEFKNFDDTDYGNLVIVSVMEGSTNPKITWLRF